jgi:hypothetical protein
MFSYGMVPDDIYMAVIGGPSMTPVLDSKQLARRIAQLNRQLTNTTDGLRRLDLAPEPSLLVVSCVLTKLTANSKGQG